jgi:polyhydroxyalkanoate synthesis repressor PhaR
MTQAEHPVTIKRYAGRRLYHAAIGSYLTLDVLTAMVEDDEAFVVREAETGADITRLVLNQITVERGRHG